MGKIICDGSVIEIIKHIGRGKGGDSFLAHYRGQAVVYKKMHYEPCAEYTFQSNKLQSELRDYQTLKKVGIRLPELLAYSDQEQYLVKQYIDGRTISEIVACAQLRDEYVVQMFEMCKLLYANGLNIDYFPPNFVVQDELLYYIDFECNAYMQEWNFEEWGIWFWANTSGMAKFLQTGDHSHLSVAAKPHKDGLQGTVARLLSLR